MYVRVGSPDRERDRSFRFLSGTFPSFYQTICDTCRVGQLLDSMRGRVEVECAAHQELAAAEFPIAHPSRWWRRSPPCDACG
jgi:hypothetical protein